MRAKSRRYWKGIWLAAICMMICGVMFFSDAGDAAAEELVTLQAEADFFNEACDYILNRINSVRASCGYSAWGFNSQYQELAEQLATKVLITGDVKSISEDTRGLDVSTSVILYFMPFGSGVRHDTADYDSISAIVNADGMANTLIDQPYRESIGLGIIMNNSDQYPTCAAMVSVAGNNKPDNAQIRDTGIVNVSIPKSYFALSNGRNDGPRFYWVKSQLMSYVKLEVGQSKKVELYNQYKTAETTMTLNTAQAVWTSSNPSVAVVSPDGTITGVKDGKTTVQATLYGQTVTYDVIIGKAKQTSSDTPSVKKLKDLPKNYQGPAVVGGKEVYVKNGKKVTGNVKLDGATYYYKNGVRFTGTEGQYYYKDGRKYTGWLRKSGKKYYYVKGKPVRNKFKTIKNKKYYFNKNGVMQKGQVKVKGKYYYFNKSGVMQKNKWIKIKNYEYYFNKKGVRTKKRAAGAA